MSPREPFERDGYERDERGATAVEYGLMVAMIAIVIIGGVTLFGAATTSLFSIPAGLFDRP